MLTETVTFVPGPEKLRTFAVTGLIVAPARGEAAGATLPDEVLPPPPPQPATAAAAKSAAAASPRPMFERIIVRSPKWS